MTVFDVKAAAKVNLSLRIRQPDATGMHPLLSLAQSISHCDLLTMSNADEDALVVAGSDLPTDRTNLVWQAIDALRVDVDRSDAVNVDLTKRIPAAAGLGGGSADAAAALKGYAALLSLPERDLADVAAVVGADVPFCLAGGLRWMEGYGERLSGPLELADDYWMVIAVPPIELATPRVYAAWDVLDGPSGSPLSGTVLPPSLREHAPLVNDLYPAAVSCEPILDDWRSDLAARWDRPVLMSGSGPSLFGFFEDETEANEGVSVVDSAARAVFAARPVGFGAEIDGQ